VKPKALLFDVFGTVVDWRSGIIRDLSIHFQTHPCPLNPGVVADAWRAAYQPSMEPIRSGSRGYVDLDTLHAENLESIAEQFKFNLGTTTQKEWLVKAWHRLPCWPDSANGIERLKEQFICASQSNGHIALAVNLAKHNHFSWDVILGAEVVRTYKPAPESYIRACNALGLEPHECMMVAAHNTDLAAARAQGLQTAFIRRPNEHGPAQTIDLEPSDNWEFKAESIIELSRLLDDYDQA
jgi:2-haloacid dehalogenase